MTNINEEHVKQIRKIKQAEISQLVKDATAKIEEAEKIATEYGLYFNFSLAYGMGGSYTGSGQGSFKNSELEDTDDDWASSSDYDQWVSSSAYC